MPQDSVLPLLLAVLLGVLFTSMLLHAWWIVIGALLGAAVVTIGWLWPQRHTVPST
jgi:hypothetical protein